MTTTTYRTLRLMPLATALGFLFSAFMAFAF